MITILNDPHIGASRKAGTTPTSAAALKEYIHLQFRFQLSVSGNNLIINGDLFDAFSIEPAELIQTHQTLADWLHDDTNRRLTLICGNHDWSPKAGRVSSFHMLCHFLVSGFGQQVRVIDYTDGLTHVAEKVWAIAHMANQDLFDMELEKACSNSDGGVLLLHANYQNGHADNSDHSLNVSQAQTEALISAGWTLMFGHEHQGRVCRGGRVVVTGNQVPTSVADCLGNDDKRFYEITDGGKLEPHVLMQIDDVFQEVDWTALDTVEDGASFVRVTGTATSEQAADVVGAISRLRQAHQAFVISNAVKIEGVADFESLSEASFEDIKKIDVLDLLLEEFNEREVKVIKELLEC